MAEQVLEDPRDAEVVTWTSKASVLCMQLVSVDCTEKHSKHSVGLFEVEQPSCMLTRTK